MANSSDKGVEIAEMLIANGADVNAKDNWVATPLHSAVWAGHKELVHLLIARVRCESEDDAGVTPCRMLRVKIRKEVAELLIAKGADVNVKADDGSTLYIVQQRLV